MTSALVFSTQRYAYLREDVARIGRLEVGSIEVATFPDSERYQRVGTPVSGRDVVLIGGTVSDADTLELFDLACSIVKDGARSLALLIPYFGYSTMERAVKAGEVVTAKTRARLFSAIPLAAAGNRVFLVDLHAEGIPHYFEGGIRPVHVYAKPVIVTDVAKAAAIVGYANEHDIDLIVLGTHGRGAVSRLLMGSVAERVVRTATCPVLTVHHPEREFDAPDALVAVARA